MMSDKKFAETIMSDLMSNVSISDILLKLKIFASTKGDSELLNWVTQELEGYENKPPKYRILDAGVKIDVFVPYRGTFTIDFHTEMVTDERVRERLTKMPFHQSIEELIHLSSNNSDDGNICMHIPVPMYKHFVDFINGHIQGAYQYTTKAALAQVIVSLKSLIVDYVLKLSNSENLDFNTFIKNNPAMATSININAGIVNTGDGTINAQGSVNITGDNNSVNAGDRQELLDILSKIDSMAESLQDAEYSEVSKNIKDELEKDAPSANYLKRCFQAIPSILTGVGSGIMANGITPLVKDAIALLI